MHSRRPFMPLAPLLSLLLLGPMLACGVGSGDPAPESVRLVDQLSAVSVEGSPAPAGGIPRTEWTFTGAEQPWRPAGATRDLTVEEGALTAGSRGPSPLLHLAWQPSPERQRDYVHSVEVRMRSSGGSRLSFAISRQAELELGPFLAPANPFGWQMTSPLMPGEETTTYTLRPVNPVAAAGIEHLLLKPVDTGGVEFAIESIRLIYENEHLASLPAGVTWQGLSGVFRETLAARAPERLQFELELPDSPRLELALGTLEPGAVTFEVAVEPLGGGASTVRRRTITTAQRWEELEVVLDAHSGSRVRLTLALEAARDGTIGLWGSPVIRRLVDLSPDRPQGVVVVLMDTLRADHLEVYGHDRPTAPTLSRLAAEGVVVEDAIAQATWTKVSVPSIMTSLYPTSHTVSDLPDLLPASAETLAERFRRAGYATLGLSAIPFTGKMTSLHQGYELFYERAPELAASGGVPEKTARRHVDALLPWLEAHRDVPFFAFLHVEDPHSPYAAPPPYDTLWGEPGAWERYREQQEAVRPKIDHPLMRRFGMPRREDLEEAGIDAAAYVRIELDAYDGLIRAMDAEIGRLVERLEELGLRERVVIAFVSDHGTEFLDHDSHFHGQSVYGELNRVPMLFWGPGFVPPQTRIPVTAETLDLMPTVLELAGLAAPDSIHGQSLVPWFSAGGDESAAAAAGWRRKPAITEKAAAEFRGRDAHGSYAIIAGGWKLIRNLDPPPWLAELELYDHRQDPLNLENVADQHPERVAELSAQLDNWLQFAESAKLASDADLAASASPEELERLRALGYL